MKTNYFLIPGAALFLSLLSGCSVGGQTRAAIFIPLQSQQHHSDTVVTYAPFPAAPRHGYRHRYYDNELQFDSNFGAYIVIGSPGLYFYGGNYLRFHNDRWQITARLRDSWRFAGEHDIPHRLRQARPHNRHNEHDNYGERHEAPRHGYRRYYQGHELSYDAGIGVYAIIDRPGIYLHNNRYLRRHNGVWQSSKKLNGGWNAALERYVPQKLKKAKHTKRKKQWKKQYRQEHARKH